MTASVTRAEPVPLSRPAAVRRTWTTPHRLAALGAVTVLLAVGLGVLVSATVSGVRAGFDVIGQQAAPQVRVSADLYFVLSDLDAQAANVLLAGPALGTQRTAALRLYEQRRAQADHDIEQAAADAGTDPAGQRALNSAIDQLGRYESLTAQSFLVNQQGNDPVGRPSPAALALYRQATDTMRSTLADVQTLTTRNSALLDSTYATQRGNALDARLWLGLAGALVIAALVVTQILLRQRLRRRTNPMLLVATALAVLMTAISTGLLTTAAEQLRVAKSDAFDSIIALSQARSVSYDANADESRYLVDPQRANQYQQAFLDKSQSLLDLPDAGLFEYDARLATALDAYHANTADVQFPGYFGTEIRNITFPGERTAAELVLITYQTYQHDDRQLRSLNLAGDLAGAVAYDTSTAPGNSNYDFNQYDTALTDVIQINQTAFTTAVHTGQDALAGWNALVPGIGTLLIIALVAIGVWPRIAEYR